MRDDTIDSISVRFRKDRMLIKWTLIDGPDHYKWFEIP